MLQITRGCPFTCTYCNSGVKGNSKVYAHSIDNVKADLLYVAERVKPEVNLCLADDNFGDPLFDAWSFTLEMKWSLFDGGRRRGQVEQLESQRRQLELSRQDLESRIRLDTRRALSDYETARARARSAELAAQVAREAVRVARESWEQGVATQTDLLDAQSRSTAADVLAVESYYDALVQASRLARAAGRIPASGGSFRSESPTS